MRPPRIGDCYDVRGASGMVEIISIDQEDGTFKYAYQTDFDTTVGDFPAFAIWTGCLHAWPWPGWQLKFELDEVGKSQKVEGEDGK